MTTEQNRRRFFRPQNLRDVVDGAPRDLRTRRNNAWLRRVARLVPWQSLGTISVATLPGEVSDAAIASAMSPAIASGDFTSRTHPDIGEASETISLVSGASAARCHVA
jgi:hypothetical protein